MTQWGLDTLFNPAKRHMDEEKRRLQSTREEVGDNSGGKRVDLESGRVKIRRDGEGSAEDAEAPEADRPDETPAMRRARLRQAARKAKPKASPAAETAAEPATAEPSEPDATDN